METGTRQTIPGGSRFADSFVLIIATRGVSETVIDARNRLREYTSAKKHQLKLAMGLGILLDAGEYLSVLCTNYDTSPLKDDPALDAKIKMAGLKPAESVATMARILATEETGTHEQLNWCRSMTRI